MSPPGLYIHIPFCKSRCSYCDFAIDVYRSSDAVERYVDAIVTEISAFTAVHRKENYVAVSAAEGSTGINRVPPSQPGTVERNNAEIDTIYFGGGTPSLLTAHQVKRVLTAVKAAFILAPNAEITMEMNPATVTPETLRGYRLLGVNRASFGVQTFDELDLKRLARGHNAEDARATFRMLRNEGFDNVSFDLIIGLPRQELRDWERNLDLALAMGPEHISMYLLEIHEGTPLAEQIRSERQPLPEAELAAEMYDLMIDKVAAAGYRQYEISNFAKPGFESRHNSKYWTLDPVFGFGVSAHSFDGDQRYANERDTLKYVKGITDSGRAEIMRESVNVASEYLFLGLRMREGVRLDEYNERFGIDITEIYFDEIVRLKDLGLIDIKGGRISLTRKGMLYSNEVFEVFV